MYYYYQIIEWNVEGGTIKRLYNTNLSKTIIAYPPLSEQQRIISILDKFESLVNDLSEGLPAEIAAVQEQYEYYRNKLLTFKRKS
ncbi:restriction endonuclease subunit S [Phocaeicola plebeius]